MCSATKARFHPETAETVNSKHTEQNPTESHSNALRQL